MYQRITVLGAVAAVALALGLSGEAQAGPCTVDDVTLTINGVEYNPSSCKEPIGPQGGPSSETATFNSLFGTSLGFLAKDPTNPEDDDVVALPGLSFSVSAPTDTSSGVWTITWTDVAGDPDLPVTLDLGVILSGGGTGAGYLFEDVTLLPPPNNQGDGTFKIQFTNRGGNVPELSHLTLLGGNVQTSCTSNCTPTDVPEPATLALLGGGLLGLGILRRRRVR